MRDRIKSLFRRIPSKFRDDMRFYTPSHNTMQAGYNRGFQEAFGSANKSNLAEVLAKNVAIFEGNLRGAYIGVSFRDLHGRLPPIDINATRPGWAASVIKIPVMIEVMRQVDSGEINLDDELVVDHRFTLEDFDPISRMPEGTKVPIDKLLELMIVVSDNEATNMLASHVGVQRMNETMQELGASKTMLGHLLAYNVPRYTSDWNEDGSNLTCASDMTLLLEQIYNGKSASNPSCDAMQGILELGGSAQLVALLPATTVVGGKIGLISDVNSGNDTHDVGVVNSDYAIAVMCNRVGYFSTPEAKFRTTPKPDFLNDRKMDLAWAGVEALLETFHQKVKLPFYFDLNAVAKPYFNPSSASSVISIVSKVVHDVYYYAEVRPVKK